MLRERASFVSEGKPCSWSRRECGLESCGALRGAIRFMGEDFGWVGPV